MDNAVKVPGLVNHFQELFVVHILISRSGLLHNSLQAHIELLLSEMLVEAIQVEMVPDVLLLHLCEVLVALVRVEPLNPSHLTRHAIAVVGHAVKFEVFILGITDLS